MSTTAWSSWLFQERPQLTFEEANKEFESLPEDERIRLMRERYGQEEDILENPAFISDSLQRFDVAMDSIPNKEAYETALFINPEYVESSKLRLAFLRADRFDAENAARRMANFWEAKVQLFGIDNVFNSHLSLFDFQEKDFPALACGSIRLMPRLDNAGRGILCCDTEQYDPNPDSMVSLCSRKFVFNDTSVLNSTCSPFRFLPLPFGRSGCSGILWKLQFSAKTNL